MPAQFQTLSFPFIGGQDDETLDRLLAPGTFTAVQDGEYDRQGTINKRPGFASFASNTPVELSQVHAATVYQDQLVTVMNNSQAATPPGERLPHVSSFFEQGDALETKALACEVTLERRPRRADIGESIEDSDMAVAGGVVVYAWVEDGAVRVQTVEESSDHVIAFQDVRTFSVAAGDAVTNVQVTPNATGSALAVTWIIKPNGFANVLEGVVVPTPAGTIGVTTPIRNDVVIYDITSSARTGRDWAVITEEGGNSYILQLDSILTATSIFTSPNVWTNISISRFEDFLWFGGVQGANVFYGALRDSTGAVVRAVTLGAGVGILTGRVSLHGIRSTDAIMTYTEAANHETLRVSTAGAASVVTTTPRLQPVSKVFGVNVVDQTDQTSLETYQWVLAGHEDNGSRIMVLVHLVEGRRARPVATSGLEVAFRLSTSNQTVTVDSQFRFRSFLPYRIAQQTVLSLVEPQEVLADFATLDSFDSVFFGTSQYYTGGVVGQWDGYKLIENTFVHPPALSGTSVNAGGGSLVPGETYNYIAIYEAKDDQGNFHRSIASKPFSVEVAGGDDAVQLTAWLPSLLWRNNYLYTHSNVQVGIYRTQGNTDGPYYRLWGYDVTPNAFIVDLSSPASVVYNDGIADSVILGNIQAYTTGGVLQNDAVWGGATILEVHKDRLWAAGNEIKDSVWYSKPFVETEPASFNVGLQINIPGERITALKSLDDALVVFTEDKIFGIFGDGPNDTGNPNSGNFRAVPISTDTGCIYPRSVVSYKDGLLFAGKEGIYQLSRGRQVAFLGQPVEQTVRAFPQFRSSTLREDRGQALWSISDGVLGQVLMYDYVANKWAVWSVFGATTYHAMTQYKGELKFFGPARNYRSQQSSFADGTGFYPLRVQTGRLSFGQFNGFTRLRKVSFIGEPQGSAYGLQLQVNVEPDNKPAQTAVFDETVTSSWSQAEFSVGLRQPKGRSFRFLLEDLDPGFGTSFPGVHFSTMGFQIGTLGGVNRLPATQKG